MSHLSAIPQKWIGFLAAALLCMVAIGMWVNMPLIPDEIAIRLQAGRFIQDNGMAQGLYALCATRVQEVPLIFTPTAWLLSLGDLATSPVDLRFISIGVLCGILLIAMLWAIKNSNTAAVLWVPAALMGVAGSTLVYFRFEVFLLIHLSLCMLVLTKLKKNQVHAPDWGLTLGLVFTLLTMAYVHPQALLFIPLTAYLCYRLINGTRIEWKRLTAFVAGFGFIAATTHFFFKLTCPDHKEIEMFWGEMVFDLSRFFSADVFSVIAQKFNLYSTSFGYNEAYTISYLPGIPKDYVGIANLINKSIVVGLCVVLVSGIAIGCYLVVHLFKRLVLHKATAQPFNGDVAIVFALIFFPSLFYMLYDGHLYFYRSFILNFLYVFAVVIALAEFNHTKIARVTLGVGVYLSVVVVASIMANGYFFAPQLKTYEGPSASLHRGWTHVSERLNRFAHSCGIDLSQGGGIINDLTYEGVKQYARMYPITYLGLQMSLANVKPDTVIALLKPNYVLARCTEMEGIGLGWPADGKDGDLCCKRYGPAGATR